MRRIRAHRAPGGVSVDIEVSLISREGLVVTWIIEALAPPKEVQLTLLGSAPDEYELGHHCSDGTAYYYLKGGKRE